MRKSLALTLACCNFALQYLQETPLCFPPPGFIVAALEQPNIQFFTSK